MSTSPKSYLRYLVKMKHRISYFYNAVLEHRLLHIKHVKFIKYTENKLTVTKCVQNVRLWHGHKHTSVLAIGPLDHQSATASSCTTHAVDTVTAHRCHELSSRTHVAEWQTITKWHNPQDLGLVSSVATCLALWNLERCIVAVQLCHVRDGQVHYSADK